MSETKIPLFLNETYLSHHIQKWIWWDMQVAPSGLVVGQSGSGKTFLCKQILARIQLTIPCEIFVLDFKSDRDFEEISGCKRFYRYMECSVGLQDFYKRFQQRQSGQDKERHALVLYIDEWSSFCNMREKKLVEEDKKMLGVLVSMGRSFSIHVIVSQQRGDSIYFERFRDNFSLCIGMGNLSDESRRMLFPDYAKELPPTRQRGTGFAAFNGLKPIPICVPPVKNPLKVAQLLKEAVNK